MKAINRGLLGKEREDGFSGQHLGGEACEASDKRVTRGLAGIQGNLSHPQKKNAQMGPAPFSSRSTNSEAWHRPLHHDGRTISVRNQNKKGGEKKGGIRCIYGDRKGKEGGDEKRQFA